MAVRMLWKYVTGRAKTLMNNYNVMERAGKIMEAEKRAPPRHPGTEVKFQVLIKESKRKQKKVEEKSSELLERLKTVKVNSSESAEEAKISRPLPQMRDKPEIPLYGYEEPKVIPEGRCSLKQALEFISKHQNDPNAHSVESIAQQYNLKACDVQNVLENFRAFEMYVSRDGKLNIADSEVNLLGVSKVIQPLYKAKFPNVQLDAAVDSKNDKK